jgi:hypothetical protein
MDFRLKYIGKEFEFFPENEKREKFDYERLVYNIERREKKILSDLSKIETLKKELREWKKERTEGYKKMVKYHKSFSPTYSFNLNKNKKQVDYKSGKTSTTAGNRSWEGTVTFGKYSRYLYLGTIKEIAKKLDLLENRGEFYIHFKPDKDKESENIIKEKLKQYLIPVFNEKITNFLNKGEPDFFSSDYKLKGVDILQSLYRKSSHYTPPREKTKVLGKRLPSMNVRNKNY